MGCKIFHGPYVSNFKEVYEHLNSLNVTKKITSYEDLSESVDKEFGENLKIDTNIVKKIEDYGLNILNSILEEIKTYIKI